MTAARWIAAIKTHLHSPMLKGGGKGNNSYKELKARNHVFGIPQQKI